MKTRMKRTTRRPRFDNVVTIIPVNNLRYSVEGYVERRHPEFAYDTGLNGFFADFINCALMRNFGHEYRTIEKWITTMAIYDDTTVDKSTETLREILARVTRHVSPHVDRFRECPEWDWLNWRQVDIVLYGRPQWTESTSTHSR